MGIVLFFTGGTAAAWIWIEQLATQTGLRGAYGFEVKHGLDSEEGVHDGPILAISTPGQGLMELILSML
jgi:hypothetical protein